MLGHIALAGDSIFDNQAYTCGEPDVATHLRDLLPAGWTVTLIAMDGAVTTDIERQVARVPADATHVVLSVGGNDALRNADLLDSPVRSTADALELFRHRVDAFDGPYRQALAAVARLRRPTTVCTIYNGNLSRAEASRARVALAMFNDVILRAALDYQLNAIELRLICDDPGDYANPIEPSGTGGRKIAAAIGCAVGALPSCRRRSVVSA